MDKSPWDSTAILIFFCHSGFPHKTMRRILFEIFLQFSLPPAPPTLYRVETRKKNSGYTRPTLFWGEGRFWTGVNRKTPQKRKSVPRLFSMIVGTRIFNWTKIRPFLCERRTRLATSFGTFLCRPCTTTTWNFRMQRLMADVNTRRIIFPSLSFNLVAVPTNSTSGKFAHIWHFEQAGTKFDKKPCIYKAVQIQLD